MPRAVLDPNVLISALISQRGAPAALLGEWRAGAFELVTSPQLLDELGEVLRREKFRRYAAIADAEAYVQWLREGSTLLADPEPAAIAVSEDPGDEYLVALARSGQADALVSGDPHLLRLGDVLPVLSPRAFLDSLHERGA